MSNEERYQELLRQYEEAVARVNQLVAERDRETTLTLRDRFAMAALTGLLASPFDVELPGHQSQPHYAKLAYEHADAMLKTRKDKESRI